MCNVNDALAYVKNKGEDRWVSKPGPNKVIYIHNRGKLNLFAPQDAATSCPVPVENLLPTRATSVVYLGGESEVIEDDWRGKKAAHRRLSHEWFGVTIFSVRPGTVVNATLSKPKVGNCGIRKRNAREGETPVLYEQLVHHNPQWKVSELYKIPHVRLAKEFIDLKTDEGEVQLTLTMSLAYL